MSSNIQLHLGDCLDILPTLPAESVHCCVTSPPYWGLRDYGAIGQLGLEATPEEYVAKLVAVFREVRRVLRDDGTLFLNLGDSYASRGGAEPAQTKWQVDGASNTQNAGHSRTPGALKPKDLVGIPWRVAFALQADGWYLRSDIIWHKPNPMPESVRDRPTKSHEYMFLLSKSAKYYYDQEAIAEPATCANQRVTLGKKSFGKGQATGANVSPSGNALVDFYDVPLTRNKRSVWTIPTQPYREAHFATYPEALVEPCILAGTSAKGVCPTCGAPWQRVIEKTGHINKREPAHVPNNASTKTDSTGWAPTRATKQWQSTCMCDEIAGHPAVMVPFESDGNTGRWAPEPIPATVLDPWPSDWDDRESG